MSSTLYIDSSQGISGDRLLAALCALGLRPSALEWELSKLSLGEFHMHFDRVGEGVRFGIHSGATHTHEQDDGHDHGHTHHHGHDAHGHDHKHECGCGHDHHHGEAQESYPLPAIREMIATSDLAPRVRERACAVFERLIAVYGPAALSGDDRLALTAQVVGSCIGLEELGVETLIASPLSESRDAADPGVLALLEGLSLERVDDHHTRISPDGAAIVAALVDRFELVAPGTVSKTGMGVGRPRGCSHAPATLTLALIPH